MLYLILISIEYPRLNSVYRCVDANNSYLVRSRPISNLTVNKTERYDRLKIYQRPIIPEHFTGDSPKGNVYLRIVTRERVGMLRSLSTQSGCLQAKYSFEYLEGS